MVLVKLVSALMTVGLLSGTDSSFEQEVTGLSGSYMSDSRPMLLAPVCIARVRHKYRPAHEK